MNLKITDPRIEAIRERFGLDSSDFWELPQAKGKWCVKHSALEEVAAMANIEFDLPQIIEADGGKGITSLAIRGVVSNVNKDTGEITTRSEWSTGEASPQNNKNSYPWAMAEKRAKDRVILKLAGLQKLLNSDAELDVDGPAAPNVPAKAPSDPVQTDAEPSVAMSKETARPHYDALAKALSAATTLAQLKGIWERSAPIVKALPDEWVLNITDHKNSLRDDFILKQAATP